MSEKLPVPGECEVPTLRAKVGAGPPKALTLFMERSALGIKTDGQAQVSSKPVLSEWDWHYLFFLVSSHLLPIPQLLSVVLTKLAFYCKLLRLPNSKGFLLPAESTAPKGPLQPDAFSGKGGGKG